MKIIRFFNQNRYYIIVAILVLIFTIAIIQILNSFAKQSSQQEGKEIKNNVKTTTYKQESKSIISGGKVSSEKADIFGDLIKEFVQNCNNGESQKAYDLLTKECKNICFNTIEDFQKRYLDKIFNTKKQISFQSWTTGEQYTYQVKLFEDMLSSGNATSNYVIDYYTIKQEEDNYKLNINNFIDYKNINKSITKNNLQIQVSSVEIYKDYSIYNFRVTNESDKAIMLDGKNKSNSVYIEENENNKFAGLIHELNNKDLIIEPNKTKKISVKFNVVYRDDLDLENMVFSNIINDYEEFLNNKDEYNNITKVKISI